MKKDKRKEYTSVLLEVRPKINKWYAVVVGDDTVQNEAVNPGRSPR